MLHNRKIKIVCFDSVIGLIHVSPYRWRPYRTGAVCEIKIKETKVSVPPPLEGTDAAIVLAGINRFPRRQLQTYNEVLLCNVVFCAEQTSESELRDRHFFFLSLFLSLLIFLLFFHTPWKSMRNPVQGPLRRQSSVILKKHPARFENLQSPSVQSKWLMQKRISHTKLLYLLLSGGGTRTLSLSLPNASFTTVTPIISHHVVFRSVHIIILLYYIGTRMSSRHSCRPRSMSSRSYRYNSRNTRTMSNNNRRKM